MELDKSGSLTSNCTPKLVVKIAGIISIAGILLRSPHSAGPATGDGVGPQTRPWSDPEETTRQVLEVGRAAVQWRRPSGVPNLARSPARVRAAGSEAPSRLSQRPGSPLDERPWRPGGTMSGAALARRLVRRARSADQQPVTSVVGQCEPGVLHCAHQRDGAGAQPRHPFLHPASITSATTLPKAVSSRH